MTTTMTTTMMMTNNHPVERGSLAEAPAVPVGGGPGQQIATRC
jgi:hypothetical protein